MWQSHGLQPHQVKQFKLSRDPQFCESLTDVVGLYLNPSEKALINHEKTFRCKQTLEKIQPGCLLPRSPNKKREHQSKTILTLNDSSLKR
jgi:hypothetical protein